jgi:hypothetical protein
MCEGGPADYLKGSDGLKRADGLAFAKGMGRQVRLTFAPMP